MGHCTVKAVAVSGRMQQPLQSVSQVVMHLLVRAQPDGVLQAFGHARSYCFTMKRQAAVAVLQGF